MPVTVFMQRHPRHDHAFVIPDPLLTRELGIPNACNRCHTDKTPEWAAGSVEKWYGNKMQRHTRTRTRWIAAARQGDPNALDHLAGMTKPDAEPPYWRAVAAGLLSQWASDPKAGTALISCLNDNHPLVREKAAHSLMPLIDDGNQEAASAVRPLLDDPVRCVRVSAAWTLKASADMNSRAGRELQRSLDFNSDQPIGHYNKAVFQLARQQPAEALLHMSNAVAWDPFSPSLRQELARTLGLNGRNGEAVEQLQQACRLDPLSADARFKLGMTLAETKSLDKASAVFDETVKLNPQHASAWYHLGLTRHTLGQLDEALSALCQAESLATNAPQVPYARAVVLAQMGRPADARKAANTALAIQPGFTPARELLQRIENPKENNPTSPH